MQLESWYSVVAFTQGIFLKIVDDMYDNNLLPNFRLIANVILQLITIYIIFFTEYFGLVWSVVIVFVGLGALILCRDTVTAPPWILTIIIGVFGLIYHLPTLAHYYDTLSYNKIKEIVLIILGFTLYRMLELVETKKISEEYSRRKIIERTTQALVLLMAVCFKRKIQDIIHLSKDHLQGIVWQIWLGQGYLWTNIITMSYLLYNSQPADVSI